MTPEHVKRWLQGAGALSLLAAFGAFALSACLDRELAQQSPVTTNVFVRNVSSSKVNKIDLLFMIDTSISMADKQAILGEAVPTLAARLTTPICVDEAGKPTGGNWDGSKCPDGKSVPEFSPIKDIHVGVISSSLGVRAGAQCARVIPPGANDKVGVNNPTKDDAGELVGAATYCLNGGDDNVCKRRRSVRDKTVNGLGFLAWDTDGAHTVWQNGVEVPATNALSSQARFTDSFTDLLLASGENGCGFEASLESIYRFLIEPDPAAQTPDPAELVAIKAKHPQDFAKQPEYQAYLDIGAQRERVNTALLAQRDAFLRPDSLLAIIALTDENDCSLNEFGIGGDANGRLLTTPSLPRATSTCDQRPNDPCCYSCGVGAPPAGCAPDPVCPQAAASKAIYPTVEDQLNVRCFNQKRRFGIDLLHNVQRYVDGLQSPTVEGFDRDESGAIRHNAAGQALFTSVRNPIFTGKGKVASRRPGNEGGLVYFAGIVGVPWQDIATPESLTGPGLSYLSAAQLRDPDFYEKHQDQLPAGKDLTAIKGKTPWQLILGSQAGDSVVNPLDPFMIESITPRTGKNPLTGASIVAPPPKGQPLPGTPNDINGHEVNRAEALQPNSDLQYACTFPFPPSRSPKPCTGVNDGSCDCENPDVGNPLCLGPAGTYSATQTKAKAYVQTRILRVLKDFGDNSIVASICPKSVDGAKSDAPEYGYNAAISAIIDRLKGGLAGTCTPRALDVYTRGEPGPEGAPKCVAIQATFDQNAANCDVPGKAPLVGERDEKLIEVVRENLRGEWCDGGGASCDELHFCRINPVGSADGSFDVQNADYQACLNQKIVPSTAAGYCYIDPAVGAGEANTPLLKSCPESSKRLLRLVPDSGFVDNSRVFVACQGKPI